MSSSALESSFKRRVIVTGGASGFGEATVRWMVNRGAKVIIADIVCYSLRHAIPSTDIKQNEERGRQIASSLSSEQKEGSAIFVKGEYLIGGFVLLVPGPFKKY